jgi:flagellin-like protein
MRRITKVKRSVRAISPVIATLLMIAIAVVASLVVYAWVTGYIGGSTTKAGKAIQIPSFAVDGSNDLHVYVQNVGQGTVQISAIYVNNDLKPFTSNYPDNVLAEGNTADLTVTGPFDANTKLNVKVTTTEGTFMTATGTPGSNTNPAVSPTPGPSATATPTPVPTATPTPTLAPTPTPTPVSTTISNSPTSDSDSGWDNENRAYTDGGGSSGYGTSNDNSEWAIFSGYGFTIPSGATVTQVRVRVDAWVASGGNDNMRLEVYDGTWRLYSPDIDLPTSEGETWYVVTSLSPGGWTPAEVNGIQARVTHIQIGSNWWDSDDIYLDWIPIEVTYTQ